MDDLKMPPEIAGAINAIMGEVTYVQKRGENKFHGYKFAAIGDLLAKVQPAMAQHGLIVIQNERSHELSPNGGVMVVNYEFTLAHKSGAIWAHRPIHTGMAAATNSKGGFDDKCVNKCMTAARKYFLMALFQIPTGDADDPDMDGDIDEKPTPRAKPIARAPVPPQTSAAPPEGRFQLMHPNGRVASSHNRASDWLTALETEMGASDQPHLWWAVNGADAKQIAIKFPQAADKVAELEELAAFGRTAAA